MTGADQFVLRHGGFEAVFSAGAVHDVRLDGWSALTSVYVAVRPPDWSTVPGDVEVTSWVRDEGEFELTFVSRHQGHGTPLEWSGTVTGRDGTLRFAMQARALEPVAVNRVGFCLLHPVHVRGRLLRGTTPEGVVSTTWPDRISPHQVLTGLSAMEYPLRPEGGPPSDELVLGIDFEGDLFETEDHRNWTDPGWKTYCTPLSLPVPRQLAAGETVTQTITLSRRPRTTRRRVVVDVRDVAAAGRPRLGAARLAAAAGPAWDHHCLETDAAGLAASLPAALAGRGGAPLDVWLALDAGEPVAPLAQVLAAAAAAAPGALGRVAVFDRASFVTPPALATGLRDALRALGCALPVGGGSCLYFTELNRADLAGAVDAAALDFVAFSLTPQVHHSDPLSVLGTVRAQPECLRVARSIAGALPVVVGPVSWSGRPAVTPDGGPAAGVVTAWTVGTLAAFATADVLTIDEVGGLEDTGGPDPAALTPGRLLARAATSSGWWSDSAAALSRGHVPATSDPVVLALRHDEGFTLLVANAGRAATEVSVELSGAAGWRLGDGRDGSGVPVDAGALALGAGDVAVFECRPPAGGAG